MVRAIYKKYCRNRQSGGRPIQMIQSFAKNCCYHCLPDFQTPTCDALQEASFLYQSSRKTSTAGHLGLLFHHHVVITIILVLVILLNVYDLFGKIYLSFF